MQTSAQHVDQVCRRVFDGVDPHICAILVGRPARAIVQQSPTRHGASKNQQTHTQSFLGSVSRRCHANGFDEQFIVLVGWRALNSELVLFLFALQQRLVCHTVCSLSQNNRTQFDYA